MLQLVLEVFIFATKRYAEKSMPVCNHWSKIYNHIQEQNLKSNIPNMN